MRNLVLTAVAAFVVAAVPAAAAPVTGGKTAVLITADLAKLGLTASLTGSATSDPATGIDYFPITGGNVDPATLAGTIDHHGSGLDLTGPRYTLQLSDFVIDTTNDVLTGNVMVSGMPFATALPLFTFDLTGLTPGQITDLTNLHIILRFSSQSASALTNVFGVRNLTGTQFGLAGTAPTLAAVPESATWAMMIAGFGLVGYTLRRRRPADITVVAQSASAL